MPSKKSMILFFTVLFSMMVLKVTYDTKQIAIEEAPVIIKQVNTKHLQCLATAIYYEAGREPFLGQVAVARVVMNRVKHGFASDPCRVIYQTTVKTDEWDNKVVICQFSWVCEGLAPPANSNRRYQQSLSIARQILAEDKWNDLLPGNTLFFHSLSVHPRWVYNRVTQIGNHVFYSKGPTQ
jgi:spore germination cell wall hydrolase CwlJ-like protein